MPVKSGWVRGKRAAVRCPDRRHRTAPGGAPKRGSTSAHGREVRFRLAVPRGSRASEVTATAIALGVADAGRCTTTKKQLSAVVEPCVVELRDVGALQRRSSTPRRSDEMPSRVLLGSEHAGGETFAGRSSTFVRSMKILAHQLAPGGKLQELLLRKETRSVGGTRGCRNWGTRSRGRSTPHVEP